MSQIRAIFDNIQHHIGAEIQGATHYIRLAMAWLTDQNLYEQLCRRANDGVKVELLLLNDDINNNARNIDLERLRQTGAEVLLVSPGERNRMHNKFCIIDAHTVITGSYNWTFQAQQNDENIVIVSDDLDFAADYVRNFNRLKQKYGGKASGGSPNLGALSKRLEMLRNALALADADDILQQRQKTAHLLTDIPQEWLKIEDCLRQNNHQEAVALIGKWLQNLIALAVYEDHEQEELKFELKALEVQLNALRDEKTEVEALISAFNQRYHLELGHLVLEILELQKLQAEQAAEQAPDDEAKQNAYEELKNQFKEFFNEYDFAREKQKHTPNLSSDDENLLKTLYKKAVKLCHPDTVQEEAMKPEAEQIFKELNNANEAKDIARVQQILDYLENGKPFSAADSKGMQKEQLRARIAHLKKALDNLLEEIAQLRNSDAYELIVQIGADWDNYFAKAKQQLETKLKHLKKQQTP
ncbi:DUF1669 domain-containing protein [Sphingobacteriales bacterium UPWRP_1]|nr:hypothetical protein B6N25_14305 [Sphingobacteriales bacterium TSM_CSS]PSJ71582.1 DUF1669 domain-containing protein [Sphingobacteriales bacterium UPWRP_1]